MCPYIGGDVLLSLWLLKNVPASAPGQDRVLGSGYDSALLAASLCRSHSAAWWLPLALLVFGFWGVQVYVLKFSNATMRAESIFFYMAATAVVLIRSLPR